MKQAKFVAYEQNVIVYILLLNFVMSFASGADHQASSTIVSKQSFNVKKIYTITFCSYATNFACFIKFWSTHHIHKRIWHQSIGERQIYITYDLFFAITMLYILKLNAISISVVGGVKKVHNHGPNLQHETRPISWLTRTYTLILMLAPK